MNSSTPSFPVLHYLPEFAQTHVCSVNDVIQPSHPLSPPFPPAFNLSQHQGLFQSVSSWHQYGQSTEASASSVSPSNEYSGWFPLGLTGLISLLSKRFSRVFSSTTIRKHQFFDPQPSLWSISTVEINVPQFWRIQSPSSSHWQILCMVRIHCLIHRHHLFAIASQGRRNKGVPWGCLS